MVLDGRDWKAAIDTHREAPDKALIAKRLESYRQRGYTYLRDGGDRWGAGKLARQLSGDYGITYRTPLAPLCKVGCYGAFIGEVFADLKEYALQVKRQKREGADFIKIMISGLMDFAKPGAIFMEGPTAAEIKQMVHIAHEEGFSVMAHCNGSVPALAAAQMGVDSIEHGAYLNEEALSAMAENKVIWVPTLSTIGNLLRKGRYPDAAVEEILESAMENVVIFRKMGGFVAPGSDAGAWAVPHDADTEEAWLVKAGVTKDEQAIAAGKIMEKF
jgi:imidazolonepropionase-like amidohydrolase